MLFLLMYAKIIMHLREGWVAKYFCAFIHKKHYFQINEFTHRLHSTESPMPPEML